MSIGSIGKLISNVDNYIMKNGTDMPSASPAAHVALTLVALLPVVSLIYKVRITQQLEQELRQADDWNKRYSTSEQFERSQLLFGRCSFVTFAASAIFFPQALASVAVRLALLSGFYFGLYKAYQLSDKTAFQSGHTITYRMARSLI